MATTVFYPGYSAGADAYYDIEKICAPFGTKAVVISDEISINATKKYIDEAQEALNAYKAEQTRRANLSDREYALEDVHKTVNRHKNIYHESDEYYEKVLDFFENRCDNVEDVEVRIYGGVIQWKYYNKKKWNNI